MKRDGMRQSFPEPPHDVSDGPNLPLGSIPSSSQLCKSAIFYILNGYSLDSLRSYVQLALLSITFPSHSLAI